MFFDFKYHKKYLFLLLYLIIFANCQLKEPTKTHGITFLKNRSEKLVIDVTNTNDTLRIIGQPHSKSINNEFEWFYIERTFTKGEFHKLGQHILKDNNVLFLSFDKYGILKNKLFLNKNNKNKVAFSKNKTLNEKTKKSFVQKFLTSIKTKMYGNK
jgi:outer membrane protein assembly factor BamE (lipoprotein component of BamABCDE complex)